MGYRIRWEAGDDGEKLVIISKGWARQSTREEISIVIVLLEKSIRLFV